MQMAKRSSRTVEEEALTVLYIVQLDLNWPRRRDRWRRARQEKRRSPKRFVCLPNMCASYCLRLGLHALTSVHRLHTVGPIYSASKAEKHRADLASCYRTCLETAKENGLRSIAFNCISTGVYGYPNDEAAEVAVETVKEFLTSDESVRSHSSIFGETWSDNVRTDRSGHLLHLFEQGVPTFSILECS